MVEAPGSDGLPYWVTAPAAAAIFILTLIGGMFRRSQGLRKTRANEDRSKQLVIESASLADMQPIREIQNYARETADACKGMRSDLADLLKLVRERLDDDEHDEEVKREAKELAKEMLQEQADRLRRRRAPPRRPPKTKVDN